MGYAVLFIWLFVITCNKTTQLTWHVLEKTLLSIQYALIHSCEKMREPFLREKETGNAGRNYKNKKRPENRIVCLMLSKNVISTVEAVSGV